MSLNAFQVLNTDSRSIKLPRPLLKPCGRINIFVVFWSALNCMSVYRLYKDAFDTIDCGANSVASDFAMTKIYRDIIVYKCRYTWERFFTFTLLYRNKQNGTIFVLQRSRFLLYTDASHVVFLLADLQCCGFYDKGH